MGSESVLMLIAYPTSLELSYGTNWEKLIKTDVAGYELINGEPDYTFSHGDEEFYKDVNQTLQEYWTLIYSEMNAAIPEGHKFIDRYY